MLAFLLAVIGLVVAGRRINGFFDRHLPLGMIPTLVHELIHGLFARVAGVPVYRIQIGHGPIKLRSRILGFSVDFRQTPAGGFTFGAFDYLFRRPWVAAWILLAPSLVPLVLALAAGWFLWALGWMFPLTIFLAVLLIYAIWIVWISLVPQIVLVAGTSSPNDGLLIWQALTGQSRREGEASLADFRANVANPEAEDQTVAADWRRAIHRSYEMYMRALDGDWKSFAEDIAALTQDTSFDEAIRIWIVERELMRYLQSGEAPKAYEALLPATEWMVQVRPERATLRGSLGSVLVELGRLEEAEALLHPLVEDTSRKTDAGISATYLGLLAAKMGKCDKAGEWLDFAAQVDPDCVTLPQVKARIKRMRGAGPEDEDTASGGAS